MKRLINKVRQSNGKVKHVFRFGFFCFIGGFSFLIDWSFFNIFYKIGFSFIIAITLSVAISMILTLV